MTDPLRYDDRRALVVGCYSGMGAATARIVQRLGGQVHGVDYREPDDELAGFTRCDLRDPADIDAMVSSLDGPFHAVFYCAGLASTHPPLDVMKVNFAAMRAVVEGVHALVPRGGAVVVISSLGGLGFADHMPQLTELLGTDGFDAAVSWCERNIDLVGTGYSFSKEAVTVYTMARAVEIIDTGVRVNCITPGTTATPMMPEFEKVAGVEAMRTAEGPIRRKADPDEIGWPLAFLNSDAASFVNGANLIVDGGRTAKATTGAIDLGALREAGRAG